MDKLTLEKLEQVPGILKELGIDMWLIFGRESSVTPDPCTDMILGSGYTWQSAFIITAAGERLAIVGKLEEPHHKSLGLYNVLGYQESKDDKTPMRNLLRQTLERIDPQKIAINTSKNHVLADGLSHAMYLILLEHLEGTPYGERLATSEKVVRALRGRKSSAELANIRQAIKFTEEIIDALCKNVRVGMSEKDVAAFINGEIEKRGLEPAWDPEHCPAVFTGPESAGAHSGPTDRKIEAGHLMNIDFGVKVNGYCSDMQRTWYFLRSGEKKAPEIVQTAFDLIYQAIDKAAIAIKPGIECWKVDQIARTHTTSTGFAEYPHGLGHEIGRNAHDGGILCPKWERYGQNPYNLVEAGQVYTLEPRIILQEYGVATIEEIVVIKSDGGAEYLSHPQRELWLVS